MSSERPFWHGRTEPEFVGTWRERFGGSRTLTPTAYLDQEAAYPYVLAAAWLFCPETIEHRGGVFLAEAGTETADRWIAYFGGDVRRAESMVNTTSLFDVFTNVGVDSYGEENLRQLAYAIGECWQGLLPRRHPRHDIVVTVTDEQDGAYGPTVTFAQAPDGPASR
ncbi:hypothetical protein [Nocardiopsis ansamitocini]|uniref:Uncharacterized protein n=1 Tax=Nocardiopsis ansamitocini TaxID=1670832 RepID=A0A9W6UIK7_9ACTN|nr:hypothetical protein [Nocardiopsis ansamitocini]GLU47150.1 hypothetical protein Nans01_15010 [Nocardiopsis ansamitocini]